MRGYLPVEVVRLTSALFGQLTGEYDSAHGLGDKFNIYMGVLMGCVLSPDRAKILLNTVLLAISATARGVALWGAGGVRRILQVAYADDWAGVCSSVSASCGRFG